MFQELQSLMLKRGHFNAAHTLHERYQYYSDSEVRERIRLFR